MRTTHGPEVVREWANTDMEALIGTYVSVQVRAPGGTWDGFSGVCTWATRAGNRFVVQWDGMGWDWPARDDVWVSVCDEHGDHRGPAGLECLATLGVRSG